MTNHPHPARTGAPWNGDAASIPLISHVPFTGPMARVAAGGIQTTDEAAWLEVSPEMLEDLAFRAVREASYYLRPDHLSGLSAILQDPAATSNDQFVAHDLLSNAVVSSREVLPMCQDTGTIIIHARRGHRIITDGRDAAAFSRGVERAFSALDLRLSQLAPLTTWREQNTGSNLPAQIHIELSEGASYELLVLAKGGGSANKTALYQETRALLEPDRMIDFLTAKISDIGTSACPPYHVAVVIGGTSAEEALTTAKLASAHHLDHLPEAADGSSWSLRDRALEDELLSRTRDIGFGAQFGGKYFCHDVRAIRMPRHNGSLPVAIAVSCSADRQVECRIDAEGTWIEELEHHPEALMPSETPRRGQARQIDLDQSMDQILTDLQRCDLGERVSLSGTLIVARDLVHAELRAALERGEDLPSWFTENAVYYAGPSQTPEGYATGSFGPTTAGRMDPYVPLLQRGGGSMVMLAKGNRSEDVARACGENGGFYLGTVGGPAARLAEECIVDSRVIAYEQFGMEAARAITVRDLPAFIVIDDKGQDFYASVGRANLGPTIGRRPGA